MAEARTAAAGRAASAHALARLREAWSRGRGTAAQQGAAWALRAAASARSLVRPRVLRHGVAAARRGNLDAAFALLAEEVAARPGCAESTLMFWEVALAVGRAGDAAGALARLVQHEAAAGACEAAADHWIALVEAVPDATLEVAALMRMLPALRGRVARARGAEAQQQARAQLVLALQRSADPRAGTLTPALALRLVEEARGLDVEVARRAAQVALASSSLHEAKRGRLEQLLRSLDAGAWPEAPAPPPPAAPRQAPAPRPAAAAPDPERAEPLAEGALEAAAKRLEARMPGPHEGVSAPPATAPQAPSAPAPALRPIAATPVELGADGLLAWEGEQERRSRIDYRAIEAIAAAEVAELGDPPVLVVDLVLRATRPGRPRSTLRMRSDAFDAAALFPERTDAGQALRALLAELLDRSGAVPLPDPDSALGVRPQRFATLAGFEAAVLSRLAS